MSLEVTVVVASHGRPLRLRWLLNALEEQTLPRERWELVVVHDNDGGIDDPTEHLLRTHPLAAAGVLRHRRLAPGTGTAARQRNVGWREGRAPLVAFTDDDCRPAPSWLEEMVAAAKPGDVVQGTTRPEPHEAAILVAPHTRTLHVDPPAWECPTCNVAYPRALLERLGGFDESFGASGEDTDLAERARAAGAVLVAAPEATVFHAVEAYTLRGMARVTWKWRDLPLVVRRHPHLRRRASLGLFWKHSHWRLLLALAGLAAAPRRRGAAVLVAPYLRHALLLHGRRPAAVARGAIELPGRAAIDAVEIAAVASGSLRHRTPVL
jgi:glycosyltransferase involved in cell wall biosynthesis